MPDIQTFRRTSTLEHAAHIGQAFVVERLLYFHYTPSFALACNVSLHSQSSIGYYLRIDRLHGQLLLTAVSTNASSSLASLSVVKSG